MDWICPVCKQPNIDSHKNCINCGCSSDATVHQIAALKEGYSGASFPEEDKDFSNLSAGLKSFSHAWWGEKVSRPEGAILVFLVYFVCGALVGLAGAFHSAGSHAALTMFASGVSMGAVFTFRFLAMGAINEKRFARKKLVLEHSLICFASCLFIAYRFG